MPKKRVSKLAFIKPDSNRVQAWYSRNKPYINAGLDFVPIVGAANRAIQGDYGMASTNLALDATGPIKWGSKLLKLAKTPGGKRVINLMFSVNKAKRKAKSADRFLNAAEKLNPKTYKEIAPIVNNYSKATQQVNRIKQFRDTYNIKPSAIAKQIIGRSIAQMLPISVEKRRRLAAAVRNQSGSDSTHGYAGDRIKNLINDYIYGNSLGNYVGEGFLLTNKEQEDFMKSRGYKKTLDADGIKMIRKSVGALLRDTHRSNINMYQLGEDAIPRDSIYPVPKDSVPAELVKLAPFTEPRLIEAGSYPTIYYRHKNPNKREYYVRDIDLNDYGQHLNKSDIYYGYYGDKLANLYDFVGNPFIQKTGIKYLGSYKYGGTIYIKKKNSGKFTATKKRTGKTTEELTHSKNPLTRKRAIFAQNARKWNHG